MATGTKKKTHKGLLKRVKITRNGHVKHGTTGGRHRKSLHSSSQNRQLRRPSYLADVERKRAQQLLGFKIRRPELQQQSEAASE